jgi:hypothetical protein
LLLAPSDEEDDAEEEEYWLLLLLVLLAPFCQLLSLAPELESYEPPLPW